MEIVDIVDDECGWMDWVGDVKRWKKVGISSLSKKLMIQAGAG